MTDDPLVSRLFIPTYGAVHTALYRRGAAREKPCADCGARAEHWALRWRDAGERLLLSDDGRPFSNDSQDYAALCVPCHKVYDRRAYCQRGRGPHLMTEANTALDQGRARCRACRNDGQRRRRHAVDT